MQILEMLYFFESELEKGNYSQFTIDYIQNKVNEIDELDNLQEIEEDIKKSFSYEIENILDIMKQSKDRELFEKIYNNIN